MLRDERTRVRARHDETTQAALKIQSRVRGAQDRDRVKVLRDKRTKAYFGPKSSALANIDQGQGQRKFDDPSEKEKTQNESATLMYTRDADSDGPREGVSCNENLDSTSSDNDTESPQCVRPNPNDSDPESFDCEEIASQEKNVVKEASDLHRNASEQGHSIVKSLRRKGEAQKDATCSSQIDALSQQTVVQESSREFADKSQKSVKDGYAEVRYQNGDIFEGYVKRDVRHGPGIYRYATGDIYDGEWINGQKHGFGIYTWPLGEVYKGTWLRGKQNGKGVFEWPGGGHYEGNWGQHVPRNSFPTAGASTVKHSVQQGFGRDKEQRIYRRAMGSQPQSQQNRGVAWHPRPATSLSQATTAQTFSRPLTATFSGSAESMLDAGIVLSSKMPSEVASAGAWAVEGLLSKSQQNLPTAVSSQPVSKVVRRQKPGLRQKSGLSSQFCTTSSKKNLRDNPDDPARAGEGADDIFMHLASAMRAAGKMTKITTSRASPSKLNHPEEWQYSSSDARQAADLLRRDISNGFPSSQPNKSSKFQQRLLADIYAAERIDNLVGFEPSLDFFERRPKEFPTQTVRHMLNELEQGKVQGSDEFFSTGEHKHETAPVSDFKSVEINGDRLTAVSPTAREIRGQNGNRQSSKPAPKLPKKKGEKDMIRHQIYESALIKTVATVQALMDDQSYQDSKKDGNHGNKSELKGLFDKFCVVKGHSEGQKNDRQFTMDKHEWLECLIHFNVLKSSKQEQAEAYLLTREECMDLFSGTKKVQSKGKGGLELAFKDFKIVMSKLENALEAKVVAMRRRAETARRQRIAMQKAARPRSPKGHAAQGAPEVKAMQNFVLRKDNRSPIGYGFGMSVVVKKMTDNLLFENPLRRPDHEVWELRSQKSMTQKSPDRGLAPSNR